MEQSASLIRGKLRGCALRIHPKTTKWHRRRVYSSTSPSRKPCSTTPTIVCQGHHPRPYPPWSLCMQRSELDLSFTPTSTFIISYDPLNVFIRLRAYLLDNRYRIRLHRYLYRDLCCTLCHFVPLYYFGCVKSDVLYRRRQGISGISYHLGDHHERSVRVRERRRDILG